MKRLTSLVLLLLAAAIPVSAGLLTESIDISVSAEGKMTRGHTLYHIDFTREYWHWYYGQIRMVTGASELEYPLDIYWGYAGIRINGRLTNSMNLAVGVDYGQNVSDPKNRMKDSDWIRIPDIALDVKFSYTESAAETDASHVNIYSHVKFGSNPKFSIGGTLGYSYQKFSFSMYGIQGWYLDGDLQQVPYDEAPYQGVNVLTYEVKYRIPYLGVVIDANPYSRFQLDIEMSVSPYVVANDLDYHLLRFKTSEAECTGAAFMAEGDIGYALDGPWNGLHWLFSLGYEFTTISTKGHSDQHWYGDEPGTPYDDTGYTIEDISHKIKGKQTALNLKITCLF